MLEPNEPSDPSTEMAVGSGRGEGGRETFGVAPAGQEWATHPWATGLSTRGLLPVPGPVNSLQVL